MKRARVLPILALLAALPACQDMDIVNVDNPDAERALRQAQDVEALLATGFYRFFKASSTQNTLAISTYASEMTTSWFNWGMGHVVVQPRIAWNNNVGWGWGVVTQPWNESYMALSNVRDAMIAINEGMRFTDGTTDQTPRARAFIRFTQGLAHGWLALFYDQAFILDETIDPEELIRGPELTPHQEVMAAAIGYLEEAIQLAEANAFQLPGGDGSWINQRPLTNTEVAQWAHAFLARYLAAVARTPAERAQVDWSRVAYHAERAGNEDATVEGDSNNWWWALGWYDHTWLRGDYDLLGPGDESGRYEAWRATPLAERTPFTIETSDRRIHGEEGPTSEGIYWRWRSTSPFPPETDGYIHSLYENSRWEYHRLSGGRGPIPVFQQEEMTLLRAEARLRAGDIPGAVELINISRVGNGKMVPLPASISVDEAWEWLKYEKLMEIAFAHGHMVLFERRGFGNLICGTPLQFPIHTSELLLLGIPNYTFGGHHGGGAEPPDCMPDVGW